MVRTVIAGQVTHHKSGSFNQLSFRYCFADRSKKPPAVRKYAAKHQPALAATNPTTTPQLMKLVVGQCVWSKGFKVANLNIKQWLSVGLLLLLRPLYFWAYSPQILNCSMESLAMSMMITWAMFQQTSYIIELDMYTHDGHTSTVEWFSMILYDSLLTGLV